MAKFTNYTFNTEEAKEQLDLMTAINNQAAAMARGSTEYSKSLVKSNQNLAEMLKATKELAGTDIGGKDYQDLVKAVNDIKDGTLDLNGALKKQQQARASGNKLVAKTYGMEVKRLRTQALANKALGAADELSGGMASKVKDMRDTYKQLGPQMGLMAVGLAAAVAILTTFNKQQEAIADQFGAIGVTRFRDDIDSASKQFTKLGYDASETNKTISTLANNFGLSVEDASELSKAVAETAKGLGLSTDESAKLLGTLTTIGGLTTQQATDLAKQTQSLAAANGVAPDEVLKDIAGNTELFAKYAKDGGANVARAAIQARKLGLEISDVTSSMEGMLDFQSSLSDEMEASALIGRNLNLQKARELSLAGDIEGFQKEILKQVGSEAEFNKMNVIQKQALAKATGLTVDKLGKMVSKEKEAATLAGEMNKQKVEDLVSAEAMTGMAKFMADIKALGVELSNTLGPALNSIVGVFSSLLSGLDSIGMVLPVVIGLMGLMAVKSAASTFNTLAQTAATLGLTKAKIAENIATHGGIGATLKATSVMIVNNAVKMASAIASGAAAAGSMIMSAATFMAAAAAGSLASFGFGTPVMIAMAVAGIAAMVAGVAKARSAGDMISPAKGQTQISTKEGGLFNMSKNDDILAGPGLAGATGGGTTINLENKQNETNSKLERVAAVLEGALSGPKPALARAMGSSVGDSVEGMA